MALTGSAVNPCILLPPGALKTACQNTQNQVNPPAGGTSSGSGNSILDLLTGQHSPLDWRHVAIRAAEVIIGVAMVVVGISAFAKGNQTIDVITKGVKKVANS